MDQTLVKEFYDACSMGDHAKVCACIAKGVDVNTKSGDGRTALMRTAKRGYEDIVETLLNNGADVRARDKNNKTALMGAAKNGHKYICQLLVEAG